MISGIPKNMMFVLVNLKLSYRSVLCSYLNAYVRFIRTPARLEKISAGVAERVQH
jgi:hypothetical protein